MAHFVPDPVIWGPQTWEQPTDLPHAKKLLGNLRQAKTKAKRKEDSFPLAKINGVIQQAHLEWSRLDKEITDHLIAVGGRANATHYMLSHNPNGLSNGDTDEETIQRKKARITIARTMVHNHHEEWIKVKALNLWIDTFLPKFSPAIFTPDQLIKMKHWVR